MGKYSLRIITRSTKNVGILEWDWKKQTHIASRVMVCHLPCIKPDFPGGSMVQNLPAMQETQEMQILFLGLENYLEEGMATHFSILAEKIPWMEEPKGLCYTLCHSVAELNMTEVTEHIHVNLSWKEFSNMNNLT